jgi:hypothetical protein
MDQIDPLIQLDKPLLLVGLRTKLLAKSVGNVDRIRVIQDLSRKFLEIVPEMQGRIGSERYAVIENDVSEGSYARFYHHSCGTSSTAYTKSGSADVAKLAQPSEIKSLLQQRSLQWLTISKIKMKKVNKKNGARGFDNKDHPKEKDVATVAKKNTYDH